MQGLWGTFSALNLDRHSMSVTYRGITVYFPRLCVLMVQVFLMQVIGLSSNGIDNWGHVSIGVFRPRIFLVPSYFIFSSFV